ncbi:MAG: hypothetical protein PSV40_10340 [Polaromonas sp.]|uniref:hypothetical protein n=1 Tax=Polaromonas sp. TaxID=1869339 RepID=UPI0024870238|nr:hypothetical protein [Polaromonas sp.]MDI1269481.1 hypothetical protein [Polaromonas sp.]
MTSTENIARALPMAVAIAAALLLAGCSSNDSKIYDSFKCARVAVMMNRPAEAKVAAAKAEPYLAQIKTSESQYRLLLSQKFTDDLELHRYDRNVAAKIIAKAYESGTCQALYN